MKRLLVLLALMALLAVGIGGYVFAAGPAPAVPLEQADAENIFVADFTLKVKPVTVEITKWPEGEIKTGQTFTMTAVAKNHSSQPQEVIYYLDYAPETPTPLLSGTVAIDKNIGYQWGQKVPIAAGAEQVLSISLSPAPWFPAATSNGDLQLKLRVVRWLGPRG